MNFCAFSPNNQVDQAIYLQLYEYLKHEILSGNISVGTKLPSKRGLADYCGLSVNTVQNAYAQLECEGYIESAERKGFFVADTQNIIKIHVSKENQSTIHERILYRFTYQGVDVGSFPFKQWRKLYQDALDEYDISLLLPGEYKGNMELRESIAHYIYASRGVKCTPDQIVVSAGTEYLMQILIQLLGSHAHYGIENPGFEKLNEVLKNNSCRYSYLDVDDEGVVLESVKNQNVSIVCVTPAHQFPTGAVMGLKRREQLLNWALENDERYLIEDDYDGEFRYTGSYLPALKGMGNSEKVIYMGSFSKSLSPALRVSYMILPLHLMNRFEKQLSYIKCPVPVLEQKVLARFIHIGGFERHLNRMRRLYKAKLDVLIRSLSPFREWMRILGADAGLHILVEVDTEFDETELISRAMSAGVEIQGISRFYFDEKKPSRPIVLLGYASVEINQIPTGINQLAKSWNLIK